MRRLVALAAIALVWSLAAHAQIVTLSDGVPRGANPSQFNNIAITVPLGGDVAAAVDYVASNGGFGTVNLLPGTYNITRPLQLTTGMTLNGSGPSTILLGPKTPAGVVLVTAYPGAQNLIIQNLVLDGNIPPGAGFLVTGTGGGNPYGGAGISFIGTQNAISNVAIRNVEIRNTGIGVYASVVNSITFSNVYVHDNNPGNFAHNAYLVGCQFVYITHSRFDDAHLGDGLHYDFSASYYLITKSEFSGNNGEGILDQGSTSNNIQDTNLDFNTNDGLNYGSSNGLITRDKASYNFGYGFNIPGATLSDDVYGIDDFGGGIGDFVDYIFTNLLLSPTNSPTQYPAILANGVTGPVDTADWIADTSGGYMGGAAVSGYSTIGAVDFNVNHLGTGSLTFPAVGANATGTTPLVLVYSNGSPKTLTMQVSVNGVPQTVSFPPTGGWSTWTGTVFNAAMVNGGNVVTLTANATLNPLIDFLGVPAVTPTVAPATPTGVTVTAVSPYAATISWTPVPGAQTYVVQRVNGTGLRPITPDLTTTSYTDTHLLWGGQTIGYQVYAQNQAGESGPSTPVSVALPTDAPAGLQASATSGGTALNWMSANGAAYYTVYRGLNSGGPYKQIATVTNTTNLGSTNFEQSYVDATAAAGTNYYYVVTATGNTQSAYSYEVSVGLPGSLTGGPAPTAEDIGAPGSTGTGDYTQYNSVGLYAVNGSGAGIVGKSDSFRYVSMPVEGDVTMTAKIAVSQSATTATQYGIAMRETLDPAATEAVVAITGGLGAESLVRASTGAAITPVALKAGIKVPYWVRLSRTGNVFTSSISADGNTWVQLAQHTLAMNSQAYIGMAVSSTEGSAAALGIFSNVSVTGGYGG